MPPAIIGAVISSVVGVAGSAYSASEQRAAQAKAKAEREKLAKIEADKINKQNADVRATGESATVEFGSTDTSGDVGTYDDFMVKKTNSALGAKGGSGLSGSTNSGLGMK